MKKEFMTMAFMAAVASLMSCSGSDSEESVSPSPVQTEDSGKGKSSDSIVIDMLPATHAIELTEAQQQLVQNINDFAFDVYRTVWQSEKRSNITSPQSLTYLMGMLNDGASGKTAEEIAQTIGFGRNNKSVVNEFCRAFISQAPQADPSVALQIANIIATNKGIELSETFKQDMQDYYDAEVASLDFSQPASVDYLNGWSNRKSNGMIPSVIDELHPTDMLVLMNAVSFKATWTQKFDVKDTEEEAFMKADGTTVSLPMMHRKAEVLYGSNDVFSSIHLPFGSGDAWAMYVLLPNEGKTIDDIIATLGHESWEQAKAAGSTIVDIKIPRFSTTSDIVLNDAIASLGAPSMFVSGDADFSGICNNQQLSIGLIKQKAAIEVTEEGTKTSAVTVARMVGMNGATKTADFHANRPFVYIIQEMKTGAVFFIGAYC